MKKYENVSLSKFFNEVLNEAFDKEPHEFWYFTKHGLGPGTVPKDVEILDVYEDDNFGTYIKLDKVLTTDELYKYDMEEKTPNEEDLVEDIDGSMPEENSKSGLLKFNDKDSIGFDNNAASILLKSSSILWDKDTKEVITSINCSLVLYDNNRCILFCNQLSPEEFKNLVNTIEPMDNTKVFEFIKENGGWIR